MPPRDIERELDKLEANLGRLEAQYNMYFSGRLGKPPWETRSLVEAAVKRYDRAAIANTGDRFRFTTLQSRFASLVELWDRGLRAREEGRAGPFVHPPVDGADTRKAPDDRVLCVTAFQDDPAREPTKLHALYESLTEARRAVGADSVPFDRFTELVKNQIAKMKSNGGSEVAFRIALKDGKVSVTARSVREVDEE